jgi:hypothetical protein
MKRFLFKVTKDDLYLLGELSATDKYEAADRIKNMLFGKTDCRFAVSKPLSEGYYTVLFQQTGTLKTDSRMLEATLEEI